MRQALLGRSESKPILELGHLRVDEEAGKEGTFSFLVALCFAINYVM
jgi:hypothetical protein